jgi:hypothetical protein
MFLQHGHGQHMYTDTDNDTDKDTDQDTDKDTVKDTVKDTKMSMGKILISNIGLLRFDI